jgi:hypothetical protein
MTTNPALISVLTTVVDILVQSGTPAANGLEERLMASQNSGFQ